MSGDSYVYAYDKPAEPGQFECLKCSESVSRFAYCARHRADMRSAVEAILAPRDRKREVSGRRKGHKRASGGSRRYWRYGLSNDRVDAILAVQDGRCAICGRDDVKLHIDYDRACCAENGRSCGECVRGLLCAECLSRLAVYENVVFRDASERYLALTPAAYMRA